MCRAIAPCGKAAIAVVVTCLGMVTGCSPPPRTVEVIGRIVYQGEVVRGALVVFIPVGRRDAPPAWGVTDGEGRYELSTYFSANDVPLGAVPGDYVIGVSKYQLPDVERAKEKMSTLGLGSDLQRYIAEDAVADMWPDGIPKGWPDGYIPGVTHMPKRILDDEQARNKFSILLRGIPLLPRRYADPDTSGFEATVERTDQEPLVFDFECTGEIDLPEAPEGSGAG
jgi:hypothetical protein